MKSRHRTAKRMLLFILLVTAGLGLGYFSYVWFKEDFLVWLLLVSSPGLFGFLYAFLDKFRDQLNSLTSEMEIEDVEVHRLVDAIQDSRRSMNTAFILGVLAFAVAVSPCVVDKAGYIIERPLFVISSASSFLLVFLVWLFYDFGDEIHDFKLWLKKRQREIQLQLSAMNQLNGNYEQRPQDIGEITAAPSSISSVRQPKDQ